MTPLYDLSNPQAEAVYLALTGVVNLPLLQKTKKNLQEARLFHAVEEVNERLRLYEGNGDDDTGLLRLFNPQHDLLADGTARPGSKSDKRTERDPHTRDMFDDAGRPMQNTGPGEPLAQAWDDSIVPLPRPAKGHMVFLPTGHALSITEVLGWDVEREAFRVTAGDDGWDGHIVSYGLRDEAEWRMLSQLLDYADGSDWAKQPLGSKGALAMALRHIATALLARGASMDAEQFALAAAETLPLLKAVRPDHIAPDYIDQYVTTELAGAEDNAHALARLCEQYAETAEADAAEGLDSVVAAAHDGDEGHDAETEQALAEGTYEPESVELGWTDSEGAVAGVVDVGGDGERRVHDYAAPAAPEPSAQQKRNAARAGTKAKAVAKGGKGKRGK